MTTRTQRPHYTVLLTFAWVLLVGGCRSEPRWPEMPALPGVPEGAAEGFVAQPLVPDSDGDGYPDDVDCAPLDPTRYPGAPERCNGLDDDCDGQLDPVMDRDADGDGFLWCDDCWDENPDFYPGAPDPVGDGMDQNCDGTDGMGVRLSPATHEGVEHYGLYGFSLASGDLDGDGCADLAVGQPGIGYSEWTLAALHLGCAGEAPLVLDHGESKDMFGYSVAVRRQTVAVLQAFYRSDAGRILVYDESFGPGAEPRLDIVGGHGMAILYGLAVLGDPPEWIQFAGVEPGSTELHFNLVSADRNGLVHLSYDTPDLSIGTGAFGLVHGNYTADVGDRDGDGQIDLALPVTFAEDAVYFFPEVGPGHTSDAPEVWRDVRGTWAGWSMGGGGDLDGDGLDDALIGSAQGGGTQLGAGRVYVTPWLGPGDRWLADEAPARVDGEFTHDWTGRSTAVGDLDGDGQDDLVVGAPGDFFGIAHGKVMVFLGPLAGVHDRYAADLVYTGESRGDNAGAAVALGDFDGSGRLDLAVGAPFAEGADGEHATGSVYILTDPL